jgi:hypothetical protein
MTVAELLKAQSKAQIYEDALARGYLWGVRESLLVLARLKFGALPASLEARNDVALLTQLERWLKRVVSANQPSELFD